MLHVEWPRPGGASRAVVTVLRAVVPASAALAVLWLAGCATTGSSLPATPPPDVIPELEDRLAARPGDPALLVELGAAQRGAGRPEEARALLERALEMDPSLPDVHFFLGLVNEDLGRPGEAATAYEAYLASADDPSAAGELEDRLRLLRREELRQAARQALATEESLAQQPAAPDRVAVFPFLFSGQDESLRPLSRALAAMLTTDLSQTDRLTVLERLSVQMLLDEMALTEEGRVDAATAARSGRLLGAGSVVQGRILGSMDELGLDAQVVGRTDPETGETRTVAVSDAAERLVDMEKQLAFDLYEAMGVSLTPAERELVSRRPTESLQAILAYGRGLEASDRGDFQEAAGHFRAAAAADPGFGAALEEAEAVMGLADALEMSTDELAMMAEWSSLPLDDATLPGAEDLLEGVVQDLVRDPAAEVLGMEGVGVMPPTILEVIIRATGGGS